MNFVQRFFVVKIPVLTVKALSSSFIEKECKSCLNISQIHNEILVKSMQTFATICVFLSTETAGAGQALVNNGLFCRRTYYEMQKIRLDEYLRDPIFDSSALPPRNFDSLGLSNNNFGQQNNWYTTQYPGQPNNNFGQQTQYPGQQVYQKADP